MLTDDPNLRQKLSETKERLVREFEATAASSVHDCFDRAVCGLVTQARIADFLPVLAERHARNCVDRAAP